MFVLKTFVLLGCLCAVSMAAAPANVYPSNLEDNMYWEGYDKATGTIKGLHFQVLCDGDNSSEVTPAFVVKLYLMPDGRNSIDDLIVVKTYELDGIHHMGTHEFANETVRLGSVKGLKAGNYRLGIWVNADKSFPEDTNDNATLFKGTLAYTTPTAAAQPAGGAQADAESDDFDDDDFDDDDFEDDFEEDDDF